MTIDVDSDEARILVAAISGLPPERITEYVIMVHYETTDEDGDLALNHVLTTNTGNATVIHMISQALHGIWEEM